MAKFNDAIKYFWLFPRLKFNTYSSQDKHTLDKARSCLFSFLLSQGFRYTFCHFYETRPLLPLCCFPWGRQCSLPPLPAGVNCHPAWLQHFSSWPLLPICSWGSHLFFLPSLEALLPCQDQTEEQGWVMKMDRWPQEREKNLILHKENKKKNSHHSMKTHLLWSGGQKHIKNTNKNHSKVVL